MDSTHVIRITDTDTGDVAYDINLLEGAPGATGDIEQAQKRPENIARIRAGLIRERLPDSYDIAVVIGMEE